MTLISYAEKELSLLEDDDTFKKMVLDIVTRFSKEGHSGASASYAIRAISRLLSFKPLTPLTGEDSEWNEVADGIYQNNRCPYVFKQAGCAYSIDNRSTRIRFPYEVA